MILSEKEVNFHHLKQGRLIKTLENDSIARIIKYHSARRWQGRNEVLFFMAYPIFVPKFQRRGKFKSLILQKWCSLISNPSTNCWSRPHGLWSRGSDPWSHITRHDPALVFMHSVRFFVQFFRSRWRFTFVECCVETELSERNCIQIQQIPPMTRWISSECYVRNFQEKESKMCQKNRTKVFLHVVYSPKIISPNIFALKLP